LKQDNNNNRIKRIWLSCGSKEQQENTLSTLAEEAFERHIVDMPNYNFLVCNHTLKKKDVVNNKQIYIQKLDIETRKTKLKECTYDNLENHYTCKPCHKSLQRGEIPKFSCPWKIQQNKCIHIMKQLNELEERLIALIIPCKFES
jgi:hypothetical protein